MPIKPIVLEPDKEMKIKIKDLNSASMELTGNGLELEFREADGKHTGDLIITPTKLIWNTGRISKSGKSINWPELFKLMKQRQ